MSADNPQFVPQHEVNPLPEIEGLQYPTYLQELRQMPDTIARSFSTPPPCNPGVFAAYIARDIPAIVLTGATIIGIGEVFEQVNSTLNANNTVVGLELIALAAAVYPIVTLANKATRGVSQRIDHLINPA